LVSFAKIRCLEKFALNGISHRKLIVSAASASANFSLSWILAVQNSCIPFLNLLFANCFTSASFSHGALVKNKNELLLHKNMYSLRFAAAHNIFVTSALRSFHSL